MFGPGFGWLDRPVRRTDQRTDEQTCGRTETQLNPKTDDRTRGRTDGSTDGQKDPKTSSYIKYIEGDICTAAVSTLTPDILPLVTEDVLFETCL